MGHASVPRYFECMRRLSVAVSLASLALVLAYAAFGGYVSGSEASASNATVMSPQSDRVVVLHQRQTRVMHGEHLRVICHSHGITIVIHPQPVTTTKVVSHDFRERGPHGTASFRITITSSGKITATCS